MDVLTAESDKTNLPQACVCLTCGDKGFEETLEYCSKCKGCALHRKEIFKTIIEMVGMIMPLNDDRSFDNAVAASVSHGEMDGFNAAAMILCGIPLDESFLQYHLTKLVKVEKNKLSQGKLYLEDCFYMMGTVDPTCSLKPNQVCIIHENGQITGNVLVYRNPGLHFGDIHIMQATFVEGLESYVGHGKSAIFFPCVGSRSIADEIAGGDFDGYLYWISKNPQLLQHFRQSGPWIERPASNFVRLSSSVIKPCELSHEQLEEELFKLCLETRFQPSSIIGVAADSWMALMDRLLILRNDVTKEKEVQQVKINILKLSDLYYEALDAPKKGGGKIQVPKDLTAELYPHYMNRDNSFTSTSILGSIFDEVCRWQITDMSGIEIRKLPCFDVDIPEHFKHKWGKLYLEYRHNMSNALNGDRSNSNEEANEVIKMYKQGLNRSYLSKYLIALLSYGGVPNEFFMDVLKRNLEDADRIYTKLGTALTASVSHGEMDGFNAAAMILCGIPLDESFLQYHLTKLVKVEKNKLSQGKLYLEDCFYMMGTVGPTCSLKLVPNSECFHYSCDLYPL